MNEVGLTIEGKHSYLPLLHNQEHDHIHIHMAAMHTATGWCMCNELEYFQVKGQNT